MKITITLTDAEIRGIKRYLKDTSNEINPKITRGEISREVEGYVVGVLYAPHSAVADYVRLEVDKDTIKFPNLK
jgi:hypothetical protein